MYVGFTGTQFGMTEEQARAVHGILLTLVAVAQTVRQFHHGDCVGGDAQAHAIARSLDYQVFIHPPKDERKRAFCTDAAYSHEPFDFLVRNHHIVDSTFVLVAAPDDREERTRSGTWSTVRYAEKHRRNTLIVYPEGDIFLRPFTKD